MIQKGNFKAHLELHSVSPDGCEAITFTHTHERSATHAEFMTHRVSRNASSARAIPRKKMDAWIKKDPVLPLHWGSNKPGMQSGAEIEDKAGAIKEVMEFYEISRRFANRLHDHYGLHKEICNRFDETFAWINVVSTWSREAFINCIALRCTPFAEPRIQRLAINMLREYKASVPQQLAVGEWHLPFTKDKWNYELYGAPSIEKMTTRGVLSPYTLNGLLVWSVARSAWVSYQTVEEKEATWELAVKRHDDCVNLKHCTPLEHQKRANYGTGRNGGTTPGFDEYRHMVPDESTTDVDIDAILALYGDRDFLIAQS